MFTILLLFSHSAKQSLPAPQAAQIDSVNMLCSAKVNANAESCVGLMTLAGRSTTMLITSTRDLGRVFTCLHDVKFDGSADFVAGIQKAQLALKHRQNNHQRQRIVVFVTSPILINTEQLVQLGKNLKKNNVAVDVINIGMEGENKEKIDAFIGAVNSGNNSRSLHVEAGSQNLVDALMRSDIYIERDSAAAPVSEAGADGGGGDAGEFPYGVDPSVDPELAMVLRISMEEERARQAAAREAEEKKVAEEAKEAEAKEGEGKKEGGDDGAGPSKAGGNYDDNDDDLYGTGPGQMEVDAEGDEEEMLRAAIEMSKKEAEELEKKEKEDGK